MTDKAPSKPKCIVMPLRPAAGQPYDGVGMGLHFLLGNIIAVHSGFAEFWFGWRYAKIFTDEAAFERYAHHADGELDVVAAGEQQKVRYWIEGWYRVNGAVIDTRLVLTDTQTGRRFEDAGIVADPGDQYIGFRVAVMNWMAAAGLPFPGVQFARILWSEEMPTAALDALGRGLEAYYRHTGYGGAGPVDLTLLDSAVALAPGAYLPHDLRGWVLYKNRDYAGASAAFLAAVDVNPHGVGAMSGLMWLGIASGNAREAYAWAEAKAEASGEDVQSAREKTARRLKKQAAQ